MISEILIFIIVICAVSNSPVPTKEHIADEPEPYSTHDYIKQLLAHLGKPGILEAAITNVEDVQQKDVLRRMNVDFKAKSPELQDEVVCFVCESGILTLQQVIEDADGDFDLAWAAIRPVGEALCHVAAEQLGYNPEGMCPGTIERYGPHMVHIFINKTMTPTYACTELNFCDPEFEDSVSSINSLTDSSPNDDVPSSPNNEHKPEVLTGRERRQTLPGTLRVAMVTDVHWDHKYTIGASTECRMYLCCRPGEHYNGTGSAGRYGAYRCNVPMRTIELFLSQLANMAPPVDIVLYGGDAPPHAMWEEEFESQMAVSQGVAEAFRRNLPNTRIFPTVGNHETYPANLYYLPRWEVAEMNRRFTEWWRDLANFTEENARTWREAGYYTTLIRPGLRILSFNTLFGYSLNFYNLLNIDRPELSQLREFMTITLSSAKQNNEKVIMLGHHPTAFGDSQMHWSRFYHDLIVQYGDIITFQTCGHTHRDHYTLYSDISGRSRGLMFNTPAANSLNNINPSARIYTLDGENTLLDYDQYYLNITSADERPEIQLAYSARQEYSMEDMSAYSWQQLANRFVANQTLFQRYYWNKQTRVSGTECTGRCKTSELCGIRSGNYGERVRCLNANK